MQNYFPVLLCLAYRYIETEKVKMQSSTFGRDQRVYLSFQSQRFFLEETQF